MQPESSIQNPATGTLKFIAKPESLEVCIEYLWSDGKPFKMDNIVNFKLDRIP